MIKQLSLFTLAVALMVPALSQAAVLPAAQTLFVSDKAAKHPKKMTLKVPIAVDVPGPTAACIEYGLSLGADATGKITVKMKVVRDGFSVGTRTLKGRVKDSHFDGCVALGTGLSADDTVEFRLVYRKFPRLSRGDGFVVIAGLIPQ